MTAPFWAVLGIIAALLFTTLGDLVSEEIRGWLDLAPRAILRLAATQLNPTQRETIYRHEWLPELHHVLRGAESRPITRLIRGTTFALGLFISSWRIARLVTRQPATNPSAGADDQTDAQSWRKALLTTILRRPPIRKAPDHPAGSYKGLTAFTEGVSEVAFKDLSNAAAAVHREQIRAWEEAQVKTIRAKPDKFH